MSDPKFFTFLSYRICALKSSSVPLRELDLFVLALIEGLFGQVQQVGQGWNSCDGIKGGGER